MRTSVSAADLIADIHAELMFLKSIDARDWKPQAVNTAEAVRKSDSKSLDLRSEAEDVQSLARLERSYRVGELAVVECSGTTDC